MPCIFTVVVVVVVLPNWARPMYNERGNLRAVSGRMCSLSERCHCGYALAIVTRSRRCCCNCAHVWVCVCVTKSCCVLSVFYDFLRMHPSTAGTPCQTPYFNRIIRPGERRSVCSARGARWTDYQIIITRVWACVFVFGSHTCTCMHMCVIVVNHTAKDISKPSGNGISVWVLRGANGALYQIRTELFVTVIKMRSLSTFAFTHSVCVYVCLCVGECLLYLHTSSHTQPASLSHRRRTFCITSVDTSRA